QLAKTPRPTLYKERLKKDKEKKDDKNLSSPIGEKVKEVFLKIDKIRGYRPPKRKAEAAAIIRMLKVYIPDQIIETYENLKSDNFWQGKELFMMTVESQIGAVINGENRRDNQATRDAKRNTKQDSSKYTGGKYGDFVKH
ncbi:hypothetical protein LCGC14_2358370, partial [marine sediment metagenome]